MVPRGLDSDTSSVSSMDQTTPDLSLPTLDVGLVVRRAALPLALAVLAIGLLILAGGGPIAVLADSLSRALSADPRWIAGAAVAWAAPRPLCCSPPPAPPAPR
jgi:hypothetical protein